MRGTTRPWHLALALSAGLLAPAAMAGAPERVVSINLCTDQLALLLADQGQLVSVSHIAQDPHSSIMADQARGLPANRGRAEEILSYRPDLVLAGTYSPRETLQLLARLGIQVVELAPLDRLEDVGPQIRQIGAALGQAARAEALAQRIEAVLLDPRPLPERDAPLAAIYQPSGYSSGPGSLSDALLSRAGFRTLGRELALTGGGTVSLETLVRARPDVILSASPFGGHSRAEDLLRHPAITALGARMARTSPAWVCPLPALIEVAQELEDLAHDMQKGRAP